MLFGQRMRKAQSIQTRWLQDHIFSWPSPWPERSKKPLNSGRQRREERRGKRKGAFPEVPMRDLVLWAPSTQRSYGREGWSYLCLYTVPNIQKLACRRRWNCLYLCKDCKPQKHHSFSSLVRLVRAICTPCAVSLCLPWAGSGLSVPSWRWDEPGPPWQEVTLAVGSPSRFSRLCIIQGGNNKAMRPQQLGPSWESVCKGSRRRGGCIQELLPSLLALLSHNKRHFWLNSGQFLFKRIPFKKNNNPFFGTWVSAEEAGLVFTF